MGLYLNPNADALKQSLRNEIYIDKSLIIAELNKLAETDHDFICMSRPRRFGKSMVGNLISAYYSKGCDTRPIFSKMNIGQTPHYDEYLNKLNVIKLDLNGWYQRSIQRNRQNVLLADIHKTLAGEFQEEFPMLDFNSDDSIDQCILKVYAKLNEKFVIIIDEYDVLVRENVPQELFDNYLSFLNGLFKDTTLRPALALAYITGIMPIVRDKVQSKLNEFSEYTMLDAGQFAPYIGFTKEEVHDLCDKYGMPFDEMERWYDGYDLSDDVSLLNPKSVVSSISRKRMGNYWSATGSFEVLKDYILRDFSGIRQDVVSMISGDWIPVNVTKFQNTLKSITNKDNVFTYLIHLGYLSYNYKDGTCGIPNEEVRMEWVNAIDDENDYNAIMSIINTSKRLLDETIKGNEEAVATALDAAHAQITNPLTYNDEHCFQSAICLAYFYANTRYTLIKEMPTGKGYADLVLIPYLPNIPAMVIELKHNKSTESALNQIKERNYNQALGLYYDNLLFVGINYDKETKKHTCKIERFVK